MGGVLWGLLGAALIGVSDCIARVTAQRAPISLLLLAMMGLSSLALSGWFAASGDWPPWHPWGWGTAAASGFLNLLALFFLYKALGRGPVSVASPAVSSFTVMLVAMNALAGEPFSWVQILATAMVFVGVARLARRSAGAAEDADYDAAWLRATAGLALLAALAVSLRMFLAQEAGDALGPLHSLYLTRVFALAGAIPFFAWDLSRRVGYRLPRGRTAGLIVVQAFLESAALAAFLVGSMGPGRIGATIGFSAFAVVTVLAARVWLGERIGARRALWIAVVAAGVMLAVAATPK